MYNRDEHLAVLNKLSAIGQATLQTAFDETRRDGSTNHSVMDAIYDQLLVGVSQLSDADKNIFIAGHALKGVIYALDKTVDEVEKRFPGTITNPTTPHGEEPQKSSP